MFEDVLSEDSDRSLKCENLTVRFGDRRHSVLAVDAVSLELVPGRTIGIVGESGSGKTTLARALVGLQSPTSGRATCLGIDLASRRRVDRLRIGRSIGMVYQDPRSSLNPRMSVREVIEDPLVIHKQKDRDNRVDLLLDDVGLPQRFASRGVGTLSGGQVQRVAIARALALAPAFVVADEPTSALDVSIQAQIVNLVRSLRSKRGFGMLIVSHDMRIMRALADDLIVMLNGQVVESGPVQTVFERPAAEYTRALIEATPLLSHVTNGTKTTTNRGS